MKELKKLLVVSEKYPTPGEPVFTFVDDLLVQFDRLGVEIQVVCPRSITHMLVRKNSTRSHMWKRPTQRGGFWVRQPLYITLANAMSGLNRKMYRRAVNREIKRLDFQPDACYAHFWHSGIASALALPKGPKVFVACGESTLRPVFSAEIRGLVPRLGGVVSVSSKNKVECVREYGIPEKLIEVFPNGVDGNVFHPLTSEQRAEQRRRMNIAPDELAVVFVGWFNERKGVKRVEAALRGMEKVKAIYIGSGDMTPEGDNIAFCGRLEHEKLPMYLGAADVFVLPTLAEGCCNAIVEAMACGLPVISSKGTFNDDLLDEDRSIRVDPQRVDEIRQAVKTLRDDEGRRQTMSRNALDFACSLEVSQRARRIKAFIEERI